MKELIIKSYSNGSYSYYSEQQKRHLNMSKELAEHLKSLKLPEDKVKFENHK